MPGLTGLEVARKIRETDRNCAILFLTGFDKFDYARQAISVRAMDYLLKPYNEQELVFAVEDAIRQVSVPLLPTRHSPLRLQSPSAGKRTRICVPPSSVRDQPLHRRSL